MKTNLFQFEESVVLDSTTSTNKDTTDGMAGTESYESPTSSEYRKMADRLVVDMFDERMGPGNPNAQNRQPMIRRSGQSDFRIYLNSEAELSSNYINSLCRFLDYRKESDTVTFILGAKISEYYAHMMGPIIAAMQNSRARIKAIAAGYCSIPETMLWVFAKEREIYRYGALTVGITDFVKVCPKYQAYFQKFLNQAATINLLTTEETENIWKTKGSKFIMYQDLVTSET